CSSLPGRLPPQKSGDGDEVGRNSSPRSSSDDIGAPTLGVPATMPSRPSGAQLQRGNPFRASKARTAPDGASTRTLSEIEEPTMTTPRLTTGADVIWNSPGHISGLPTSILTSPP